NLSGHPDAARRGSNRKGDEHEEDRFCAGHARSIGCGLDPDDDAARRSVQWMRPRQLSRTVWLVPPVRHPTVSGRLQRPVSQCLSLERLPARLLARSVGTLPRHPLSWAPAQWRLESLSRLLPRGWLARRPRGATYFTITDANALA